MASEKGGKYLKKEEEVCYVKRSSEIALNTSIRFGEKVTDDLLRSFHQRGGSETRPGGVERTCEKMWMVNITNSKNVAENEVWGDG